MVFRVGTFDPFHPFRSQFDRQLTGVLDNLAAVSPRFAPQRVFPAVNVWEQGDSLVAEAEMPGLKNEDLEISVVRNELTIKGQRRDEATEGNAFHRRERGVGAFSRVIRLPVEIDASRVEASLHDGVLMVTMPKHENAKPRKISVSGGQ